MGAGEEEISSWFPFVWTPLATAGGRRWRQQAGLLTYNSRAQLMLFFSLGIVGSKGRAGTSSTWAMLVGGPPAQEGSSNHPAPGRRGNMSQQPSSALSQDTSSINFSLPAWGRGAELLRGQCFCPPWLPDQVQSDTGMMHLSTSWSYIWPVHMRNKNTLACSKFLKRPGCHPHWVKQALITKQDNPFTASHCVD